MESCKRRKLGDDGNDYSMQGENSDRIALVYKFLAGVNADGGLDGESPVVNEKKSKTVVSANLTLIRRASLQNSMNGRASVKPIEELLDGINFQDTPVIAIDGMTGVGKSSLIQKLTTTRRTIKFNQKYFPMLADTQFNINRNIEPYYSFFYYDFMQKVSQYLTEKKIPAVWDRYVLSNYAWYAINHLLVRFKNETIPAKYNTKISSCLHQWFHGVDFDCVVEQLKSTQPYIQVIYLIDSSVTNVAQRLLKRNNSSDLPNISNINFLTAQLHVYRYIACKTNSILIDYANYFEPDNSEKANFISLENIQRVIVKQLDYNSNEFVLPKHDDSVLDLLNCSPLSKSMSAFTKLCKNINFTQNEFAFQNSKK